MRDQNDQDVKLIYEPFGWPSISIDLPQQAPLK